MSKIIAVSGPSATGKTSLVNVLSTHQELSNVVFSPDLFNTVWSSLVREGIFTSYDEIIRDSDYICIYLIKILDYYEEYLKDFEETDDIVILDCCWLDLLSYALLNMWCTRPIKSLQEDVIGRINSFHDSVDRIYLTKYDTGKRDKQKYRNEFQVYSVKDNRDLELKYYEVFRNFSQVTQLPTSDLTDASLFILNDLRNLGYL